MSTWPESPANIHRDASAPAATAPKTTADTSEKPQDEIDWDEEEGSKAATGHVAKDVAAGAEGNTATEQATSDPPAVQFSAGLTQSDADKEAEKRAARAKRFGITASATTGDDDDAAKKAERAKKFGTAEEEKAERVKGLDSALPERKPKRARDDKAGGRGEERKAKRQTPDARGDKPVKTGRVKGVLDDPVEKAKAEARAAKFGAKV